MTWVIPLVIVAVIIFSIAESSLEDSAFSSLQSVLTIKKNQVDSYFSERMADLKIYADNSSVLLHNKLHRVPSK